MILDDNKLHTNTKAVMISLRQSSTKISGTLCRIHKSGKINFAVHATCLYINPKRQVRLKKNLNLLFKIQNH